MHTSNDISDCTTCMQTSHAVVSKLSAARPVRSLTVDSYQRDEKRLLGAAHRPADINRQDCWAPRGLHRGKHSPGKYNPLPSHSPSLPIEVSGVITITAFVLQSTFKDGSHCVYTMMLSECVHLQSCLCKCVFMFVFMWQHRGHKKAVML